MAEAPAKAVRHAQLGVVLIALFVVLTWPTAYAIMFSRFLPYDDEGYVMISLQAFLDGGALYDEVYSEYGPFYYLCKFLLCLLPGVSVTHDATRLTTLVLLQAATLGCGVITARLSRSLVLAALVALQCFFTIITVALEAGHPQELCLVLVVATLLAGCVAGRERHQGPGAVALGACLGALLLTKINIGSYVSVAALLCYLGCVQRSRWQRGLLILLAFGAMLLPLLLMRRRLDTAWGGSYCLLMVGTMIPTLALLPGVYRGRGYDVRTALQTVAGVLGVALLTLGFVFLRGTSPGALLDALILRPLGFSSAFYLQAPLPPLALLPLALSLLVAIGVMIVRRRAPQRNQTLAAAVLKGLFGVAVFVLVNVDVFMLLFYAMPFLWVMLLPRPAPVESEPAPNELGRLLLCLTTLLHGLVAFPVAGNQILWSIFLLIPVAALALADAYRVLAPRVIKASLDGRGLRAVVGAVALLLLYGAFFHGKVDSARARTIYQSRVPLDLPGARRLRLSIQQVGALRWVVQNLRAHCDGFFSLPGINSLYFWAEMKPPNGLNAGHWFHLFDADMEARVLRDLSAIERRCIVVNRYAFELWEQGGPARSGKLFDFIRDEHRFAFKCQRFGFYFPSDRAGAPPDQCLLFGEREHSGVEDSWLLPPGLLSAPRPFTLSGWFKSSGRGVVLGAQNALAGRKLPASALSILEITGDGRLRACLDKSGTKAVVTEQAVNDGRWHHLALQLDGTRLRLFLDAVPQGEAAIDFDARAAIVAQLGAGARDGQWVSHQGALADFSLALRLLSRAELSKSVAERAH